jgi:hypothetical protein
MRDSFTISIGFCVKLTRLKPSELLKIFEFFYCTWKIFCTHFLYNSKIDFCSTVCNIHIDDASLRTAINPIVMKVLYCCFKSPIVTMYMLLFLCLNTRRVMSSSIHSESRYSIYVSHAGAPFSSEEEPRPPAGLEAEPICTQFQKENFLNLSAIEARASDLYWVPLSHSEVPEVYCFVLILYCFYLKCTCQLCWF